MPKLIDLTGQRFGRLQVLERAENGASRCTRWLCLCDCGKKTIISSKNLRSAHTKSCGCLHSEVVSKRMKVLHTTHGETYTRLFRIWDGMKKRCYNPKAINYKIYGGRGITICSEWHHDFTAFRDWAISHGYADNLSIDRIDNDKGYFPENCRWTTAKEQAQNRRPYKPRNRKPKKALPPKPGQHDRREPPITPEGSG